MENNPVQAKAELLQAINDLKSLERKNLRINRIKAVFSMAALLIILITVMVASSKAGVLIKKIDMATEVLTEAGNNINRVSEDVEKLEFERLGKTLNSIADTGEETINEIHDAVGGLDTLVKDADEAMMHINSVDFKSLNDGIQRLNEVLEPIANFFHIFH